MRGIRGLERRAGRCAMTSRAASTRPAASVTVTVDCQLSRLRLLLPFLGHVSCTLVGVLPYQPCFKRPSPIDTGMHVPDIHFDSSSPLVENGLSRADSARKKETEWTQMCHDAGDAKLSGSTDDNRPAFFVLYKSARSTRIMSITEATAAAAESSSTLVVSCCYSLLPLAAASSSPPPPPPPPLSSSRRLSPRRPRHLSSFCFLASAPISIFFARAASASPVSPYLSMRRATSHHHQRLQ